MNAAPAYKTAAMNAKRTGAPHGILITTTPGSPYRIWSTTIPEMRYIHLYSKCITVLWLTFFELLEHAKACFPIWCRKMEIKAR